MTVRFMFHFTECDKRASVCERVILSSKRETMQKQCTLPSTWKTFDVEFLWCYKIWVLLSIVKPTRCTNFWNLFYFGITLYMFQMVFLSVIIRSSTLYIQQQAYVKQILLPACKQATVSVWHMPVAVCTVLNSWWWRTERPSETCRVLFQNKINFKNWCI
jgi:hypothetical protein